MPNVSFCFCVQLSSVHYLTKALSTFHQLNAFEQDGLLVMDMCASDDGQAINNYMVQNLRQSGEALDEVSTQHTTLTPCERRHSRCAQPVAIKLSSLEMMCFCPQVYNTMSRVFPRRFVLPLNVDHNTPIGKNLNTLPDSTATAIRISKDKV